MQRIRRDSWNLHTLHTRGGERDSIQQDTFIGLLIESDERR
jgi:hypothetical protein